MVGNLLSFLAQARSLHDLLWAGGNFQQLRALHPSTLSINIYPYRATSPDEVVSYLSRLYIRKLVMLMLQSNMQGIIQLHIYPEAALQGRLPSLC